MEGQPLLDGDGQGKGRATTKHAIEVADGCLAVVVLRLVSAFDICATASAQIGTCLCHKHLIHDENKKLLPDTVLLSSEQILCAAGHT